MSVQRSELPAVFTESPALASLGAIFSLLSRISAIEAAMSATEARLVAARIDRHPEGTSEQLAEYRALRDSLLLAAGSVPLAVADAVEALRSDEALSPLLGIRSVRRDWKALASNGVTAKDRRSWIANGLTPDALKVIEQALARSEIVPRPIEDLLAELTQAVAQIAVGIQDEAELVLNPPSP